MEFTRDNIIKNFKGNGFYVREYPNRGLIDIRISETNSDVELRLWLSSTKGSDIIQSLHATFTGWVVKRKTTYGSIKSFSDIGKRLIPAFRRFEKRSKERQAARQSEQAKDKAMTEKAAAVLKKQGLDAYISNDYSYPVFESEKFKSLIHEDKDGVLYVKARLGDASRSNVPLRIYLDDLGEFLNDINRLMEKYHV